MKGYAVLFALLLMPLILAPVVQAQQETTNQPVARETRKTPAMREQTYKRLSMAREQAEAGQYNEAMQTLKELGEMRGINSYELAQMYNFYGYIYFQLENFPASIGAYEKVLAQEGLPLAMEISTRYSLAQLYLAEEEFDKAVVMLERWFALSENPGADPYALIGQALYQQGQALERDGKVDAAKAKYREAIPKVENAMSIAAAQGKPPKEQWLLLLRAFYFALEDYDNVIATLEMLIELNPKRDYWIQLSGIHGANGDEHKQFLCYEMAYLQGLLRSNTEYVTMAQLYMQADAPWKAAQVLEEGIAADIVENTSRNHGLLSQALIMAREDERALEPLKRAASMSGDGNLYLRMANVYANLGQWGEAADAARSALASGELRRADQAAFLLGTALYNLEDYNEAIDAFRIARNDERSQRAATDWITHISNEQTRLAQLSAAINN